MERRPFCLGLGLNELSVFSRFLIKQEKYWAFYMNICQSCLILRFWRDDWRGVINVYHALFTMMEAEGIIELDNRLDMWCLCIVLLPRINHSNVMRLLFYLQILMTKSIIFRKMTHNPWKLRPLNFQMPSGQLFLKDLIHWLMTQRKASTSSSHSVHVLWQHN